MMTDMDDDQSNADAFPGSPVENDLRLLEALLFASKEPLSERLLAARISEGANVKELLKILQERYTGRGVQLAHAGGSWAFRTAPDLAAALTKEVEVARKLSRAAVETLAIVAYHQPVTRGEIEEIRGVGLSKGTMDVLLAEGWIKPRGRRKSPGRPLQWGTTDGFLDHFGLEHVRDLPGLKELKDLGLLEAGPALNVYRAKSGEDEETGDEAAPPPGGGDLGLEDDVDLEGDPLDPLEPAGDEANSP